MNREDLNWRKLNLPTAVKTINQRSKSAVNAGSSVIFVAVFT
jgi:hypothetical protein